MRNLDIEITRSSLPMLLFSFFFSMLLFSWGSRWWLWRKEMGVRRTLDSSLVTVWRCCFRERRKKLTRNFQQHWGARFEVVNTEFGEGYLAWFSDFLRGTGLLAVWGRSTWRFAMGGTQKVERNWQCSWKACIFVSDPGRQTLGQRVKSKEFIGRWLQEKCL